MVTTTLILFLTAAFIFSWCFIGLIKPKLAFCKTRKQVGKLMLASFVVAIGSAALKEMTAPSAPEVALIASASEKVEAEKVETEKVETEKAEAEKAEAEKEAADDSGYGGSDNVVIRRGIAKNYTVVKETDTSIPNRPRISIEVSHDAIEVNDIACTLVSIARSAEEAGWKVVQVVNAEKVGAENVIFIDDGKGFDGQSVISDWDKRWKIRIGVVDIDQSFLMCSEG